MASPTEHRTTAEELLARAKTYPHNSAARLATLTEAQVHATLYLSDLTAAVHAPHRIVIGAEQITPESFQPSPGPLIALADDHGTPPIPEVEEALKTPAKPRRTRKAPTAKEADK